MTRPPVAAAASAALLLVLISFPVMPAAAVAAAEVQTENEAGGVHTRVVTSRGPIHLFRPAGYNRKTAGIVLYVHGLYTRVDDAWREHRLAEQFAASRRNALFIAPEAPAAAAEPPVWTDLPELLSTAMSLSELPWPRGSVVAVGHSGAYRTLVTWLDTPSLRHIVLVDALYGNEADFRAWLNRRAGNRMTVVVRTTEKWTRVLLRATPHAARASRVPASIGQLSRAQRGAKLLSMRSQYGHMELVTGGKTIPVLLHRTPLRPTRKK